MNNFNNFKINRKQVEPIKLLERIQKLKDQVPKYQKEVEKASALEQVKQRTFVAFASLTDTTESG
jgi:hypothetical protein